jgi:hypothetical protein
MANTRTSEEILKSIGNPLAEPRPGCPTTTYRDAMIKAVDMSLAQNLGYIDQLIDRLAALKMKLQEGADLVKAEISGHYGFAAEALAFADKIEQRFHDLANGGGHDRQDAPAQSTAAAGDGGTGGDGDEPVHGGARPGLEGQPGGAVEDAGHRDGEFPGAGHWPRL